MPIGEYFDLEELAACCRVNGRWSFFLSSVPLKVSELSCRAGYMLVSANGCFRFQGVSRVRQMRLLFFDM